MAQQTNFEYAVSIVIKHEGGYVDNPNDPGGETKYGITKRDHPGIDIKSLTKLDAAKIYHREYWLAYKMDRIVHRAIATKILDMMVNLGAVTAITLVQRAVNYLVPRKTEICVDGSLGPQTIKAINTSVSDLLILALRAYHVSRYVQLVESSDTRFEVFSKNWLQRAMS